MSAIQMIEAHAASPDTGDERPVLVHESIHAAFAEHADSLRVLKRKRREHLQFRSVVDERAEEFQCGEDGQKAAEEEPLGVRLEKDAFQGDTNMRTLRRLLKMVDDRGWERSHHQLSFHDSFLRACSRVIYRDDWSASKPDIMSRNGWSKCPSEVLVSTPRRFGKTFRCTLHHLSRPMLTSAAHVSIGTALLFLWLACRWRSLSIASYSLQPVARVASSSSE